MEKDFETFGNRLAKMDKHISKWARRTAVSCYRIYDHDVPQYPFAIDRYEAYLYVTEYQTSYPMNKEEHDAWLGMCLTQMVRALDIPLDNIFYKTRKKQKGAEQYIKSDDEEGFETIVYENGLKFIVNLSDYLDTGLFLDHRNTRKMVLDMAEGKSVLNLFAYTGSFSVYAAAGAAAKVVTIDLSHTYLTWAKENMIRNEFYNPDKHLFVQADVKEWLAFPMTNEKYDIIVLDPPTFSNSKKMLDVLDIQRDHAVLINQALRILSPTGTLFFSTNFRRFQIEANRITTQNIKNISGQTVPNDFRDKKIHHCFEIKKGENLVM